MIQILLFGCFFTITSWNLLVWEFYKHHLCLNFPLIALYVMILVIYMWLFITVKTPGSSQIYLHSAFEANMHLQVCCTVCVPKASKRMCRGLRLATTAYCLTFFSLLISCGPQETKFGAEGLASADPLIWLVSCLLCSSSGSLINMIAFAVLCWPSQAEERDRLLRSESSG